MSLCSHVIGSTLVLFSSGTLLTDNTSSFEEWFIIIILRSNIYHITMSLDDFSFWRVCFSSLWTFLCHYTSALFSFSSTTREHQTLVVFFRWVCLIFNLKIGRTGLVDQFFKQFVICSKMLLNYCFRSIILSNGVLVGIKILVCLSFSLVTLNMQIELT